MLILFDNNIPRGVLVVLSQGRWRLVRQRLEAVAAAGDAATPGSYTGVELPID